MKLALSSIFVNDQSEALRTYTERLGFVVAQDIPMGPFRWLTVSSPDGIAGMQLLLEPNDFPAARAYQEAIYAAGKPAAAFFTDDIAKEHARLIANGVVFRSAPTNYGAVISAIFEDGCGNLINLAQPVAPPV
jgi:catechol 2,3-dioxygenase-like lactoylglutathione lyase family enzyme